MFLSLIELELLELVAGVMGSSPELVYPELLLYPLSSEPAGLGVGEPPGLIKSPFLAA